MPKVSPLRLQRTPNRDGSSVYFPPRVTTENCRNSNPQNENLYPALPLHPASLASMFKGQKQSNTIPIVAASEKPTDEDCHKQQPNSPPMTPSPTRPKPTHRRESLKTNLSRSSETWTGDTDFFPDTRSSSAICAPQRALTLQFQPMPIRQSDTTNMANPHVQKWLETLDISATTPREIEEVDTPPLSPNVEIDRGSMRRWRRKWEAKERGSNIDDEDLLQDDSTATFDPVRSATR